MMTLFAPNRTKRLLSGDGWAEFEVMLHRGPRGSWFWFLGSQVMNYEGWSLFRLSGSKVNREESY